MARRKEPKTDWGVMQLRLRDLRGQLLAAEKIRLPVNSSGDRKNKRRIKSLRYQIEKLEAKAESYMSEQFG